MTRIDLVTGLLGAGKTTFLRRYGEYLRKTGVRFALVENEYGAAGVDGAFLAETYGDTRELSGGCICCTLKSGFYEVLSDLCADHDRIIVEPSGIYSLADFFEVINALRREGLADYGMCVTLVDATTVTTLAPQEREILRGELSGTGAVLWSKADLSPDFDHTTLSGLFGEGLPVFDTPAHLCGDGEFLRLQAMPSTGVAAPRAGADHSTLYQSTTLRPETCFDPDFLQNALSHLFACPDCGTLLRVKGFVNGPDSTLAVNAVPGAVELTACQHREPMLNFIGRGLNRRVLRQHLEFDKESYL